MQRLRERTQYVVRRAQKLAEAERQAEIKTENRNKGYQYKLARKDYTSSLRAARQALKDDWALGPLAPCRHLTNEGQDGENAFGTAPQSSISAHKGALIAKRHKKHWVGSGRYTSAKRHRDEGWTALPVDEADMTRQWQEWLDSKRYRTLPPFLRDQSKNLDYWLRPSYTKMGNYFREGDRVVVMTGLEAGKISTIDQIEREEESIKFKDLNKVEISYPKWMQTAEQMDKSLAPWNRGLHTSQVRLVHVFPARHPANPTKRAIEKILDTMHLERRWHPAKGTYTTHRLIPGTLEEIDDVEAYKAELREKERNKVPDEDYGDDDTLRLTVDQVSFRPELGTLPLPESMLDELRGKYSKFRVRHEPEFFAKLEAIDEAEAARAPAGGRMATPRMQVNQRIGEEVQRRLAERREEGGEASLDAVGRKVWEHLANKDVSAGVRVGSVGRGVSRKFERALVAASAGEQASESPASQGGRSVEI